MIATVAKALLFPQSLEALGDIGYGLSTECWWSPNHPFKSSLTGQTCQEIADAVRDATTASSGRSRSSTTPSSRSSSTR